MEVYLSSATSTEAGLQRMRRGLTPLLEKIYGKYDKSAPKEVDIDTDNNLLINGTPVGDWRSISRFETYGPILSFKYGDTTRMVIFGTDPLDPSTCNKISGVYEYEAWATEPKTIYEALPDSAPPTPKRGIHL